MTSLLFSVLLFLTPSPTQIYLGELVPPIEALKLNAGEPAPELGAFLRVSDWIAIQTAFEGSVSICEWAVSEAVSVCLAECEKQTPPDLDLLRKTVLSYENTISDMDAEITRLNATNHIMLWSAIGASSLAVLSLFIWSMK